MNDSLAVSAAPPCPLCGSARTRSFVVAETLQYYRCSLCDLAFQDPATLPAADVERAQYDLHENFPADPDYRRFLQPVVNAVRERVTPPAKGLDFGCGPGPALASMLEESGYAVSLYDHFYYPETSAVARQYDFLTCTETAEHFHRPARSFGRMFGCLRPQGSLFLMTRLLLPETDFAGWWYRRDPTHVVFYSPATLHWIARDHAACVDICSDRLAIFSRA